MLNKQSDLSPHWVVCYGLIILSKNESDTNNDE